MHSRQIPVLESLARMLSEAVWSPQIFFPPSMSSPIGAVAGITNKSGSRPAWSSVEAVALLRSPLPRPSAQAAPALQLTTVRSALTSSEKELPTAPAKLSGRPFEKRLYHQLTTTANCLKQAGFGSSKETTTTAAAGSKLSDNAG